ncbi:MAG: hypothetical protein LCH78_11600 [Proteobacteria bacterium]|nr:hypothetical protein [Pseudomonadota bacterium]
MTSRPHWANCITHSDAKVDEFLADYFAQPDRTCLLVGGAGFDPRARMVAERLAPVLGDRLRAMFIREERANPNADLTASANETEAKLKALIKNCEITHVQIFAEDGASVGGVRVSQALRAMDWPDVTDVVLDLSALSVGIGFPAARVLLAQCEERPDVNFHLMVVSNPELDAQIVPEPSSTPAVVRGFSGPVEDSDLEVAKVWLPHLAPGKRATLAKIHGLVESDYKICPVLPFPSRDPRRPDALISEYHNELRNVWNVDQRDLIYVSERNPLDAYRTFSTLKARYDQTMEGIYRPQLILSPVGSKVMAAGALMAAIDHNLTVLHVEAVRYELDSAAAPLEATPAYMIVHVWLHGPIYAGYQA